MVSLKKKRAPTVTNLYGMTLVLGCKTPFILFFFFLHFFEGLTTSVAIKTLLCIANFDKKYITVAFFLSPLSIPTFSHLKNITEHLFHNKCIILTRFSIVLLVSCTIDVIKQDVLSGETNVITETGDSWFNCQRLCLPEKSG